MLLYSLKMPDNCRVMSVNCLTMTENSKKCQNAPTVRQLGTYLLFPLSYDRFNLIYLHGKSVFFGRKARGIQIWYYFNYIPARLTATGETLINNYLSKFPMIPAVPFNWPVCGPHPGVSVRPKIAAPVGDPGRWWIQVDSLPSNFGTSVKFSGYLDTWVLVKCRERWYKDTRLEKHGLHLTGIYFW